MSEISYPLLDSPRHIRLLRITRPANVVGQLPCYELLAVCLDDTPAYAALSYTWGNPLSSDLQGAPHWPNHFSDLVFKDGQKVSIGQNLSAALKSFHQMCICGDFWIDAICINQKDMEERNLQVAIMGDIYASAENVIVWLGESDWNSQVALVFLEKFMPKLKDLKQHEEGEDETFSYSFSDPRLYDRIGEPMIREEILDGLASFLERAWFKRAWTSQEIVLARRIQVFCGTTYFEREQLERLLAFLETSDWDMRISRFHDASKIQQVPGRMIRSTMMYRRHVAEGGPHEPSQRVFLERLAAGQSPTDLLVAELDALSYSMRCRKATDIRDHVYALYGIASGFCESMEVANPLPAPDYQDSCEETYTRYALVILQNSNTLLPSPTLKIDLTKGPPPSHHGFLTSAGSGMWASHAPALVPITMPVPIVEAYHFDTVAALGDSDLELGAGKIPFTQSAKILLNLPAEYHTGQDRVEVLWRTLVANQGYDQCPAPTDLKDAVREHVCMFCSMALLEAGKKDLAPFEALARIAISTSEAARALPSLSEIIDRKDVYAEIQKSRDLDASDEGIPSSQLEHANSLLQSTLAAEAKALPFAR
ncbi:MAG: hypothetical protein Q9221_008035 [Calogaya cf. arnoldii]